MGYVGNVIAGGATHLVGSTLYGTCTTAAATAAKEVTCANFDQLITGVTIHVKFTYSNTAASPTLNVNGTEALKIYRYGTTAPSTSAATSWQAGAVIAFTYDGTSWMMNDWLDTNTTYSAMSTSELTTGTATTSRVVRADYLKAGIEAIAKDSFSAFDRSNDGLVPHPTTTTSTRYLREDGTWVVPSNTDTKVTQTLTSTNAAYPLLLAPSGQTATATTTSYFDSGVTLNPSTNTITANISGSAAIATTANGFITQAATEPNLDKYTTSGFYLLSTSSATYTNMPAPSSGTGVSNGYLLVIAGSSGTIKQIIWRQGTLNSNDWQQFTRTRNASTWSSWSQFVTMGADSVLTAVGNSTNPVYIAANGNATKCGSVVTAVTGTTGQTIAYKSGYTKALVIGHINTPTSGTNGASLSGIKLFTGISSSMTAVTPTPIASGYSNNSGLTVGVSTAGAIIIGGSFPAGTNYTVLYFN